MELPRIARFCALAAAGCAILAAQPPPKLYNTTKKKLLEGKHVFSFTQSRFDIAGYCDAAKHSGVTPFLRLPDAQEWHVRTARRTAVGSLPAAAIPPCLRPGRRNSTHGRA